MSEPRDLLGAAFRELEESMSQQTRLPGVEAAYATVRRRRHYRIATVSAAVVVFVLAPAVAFAVLRGTGANSPEVGTSPGVTTPAPSPTGSATPSGPPALRVLTDVYGATALDEALLPVPDFRLSGCPAGRLQFHSRQWKGTPDASGFAPSVGIDEVLTGDVNGDGSADVVAWLSCVAGRVQGYQAQQVAAYTENTAGDYALIGQVVSGDGNSVLGWPHLEADGSVRVAVKTPLEPVGGAQSKWHSFRWSGARFEESAAPVVIPPASSMETPTQLAVTVTPQAVTGTRATLTVTVRNAGPTTSDYLVLSFTSRKPMTIKADGWPASLVPAGGPHGIRCQAGTGAEQDALSPCHWAVQVAAVPSGQSATGTFTIELVGSAVGGAGLEVHVGGWLTVDGGGSRGDVGDNRSGFGFNTGGQPNATSANQVTVPITVS